MFNRKENKRIREFANKLEVEVKQLSEAVEIRINEILSLKAELARLRPKEVVAYTRECSDLAVELLVKFPPRRQCGRDGCGEFVTIPAKYLSDIANSKIEK